MDKLKTDIIKHLSNQKADAADLSLISSDLELKKEEFGKFENALNQLEQEGKIIITKKRKAVLTNSAGYLAGTFSCTDKGYGFVINDDFGSGDLFVAQKFFKGAIHGDFVLAKIIKPYSDNRQAEGEIIKILKRNTKTVVGKFEKNKNFGYVVADNKKIIDDIYIPKKYMMGAKNLQKVVVEIIKYSQGDKSHEGKIIDILGSSLSKQANYLSVLYSHGIDDVFPKSVISEIKNVPDSVLPKDIIGRLDLRNKTIFTIDGADAKDFDDAISVYINENKNFVLGVHIADVSHYVKPKSAIDNEAYNRGTSLYFVDKVVPMLPEELSNGICSLKPNVERLTMSCIMEIDKTGTVLNYDIKKSVIKSCERLIYKDVTNVLEDKDPQMKKRYEYLLPTFENMAELAKILYKKRILRGCLDFDFPESKILLDDNGDPIEVVKRERGFADQIIEEFMLVANETIAQHVFDLNLPLVYRIHEPPSETKIETFYSLLAILGYSMPVDKNKISSIDLQKILQQIKGKKEEQMLSVTLLRSLMKAKYSHQNLGHFGLAAKYYCHFTSPIRRYPDLVVHRILKLILDKNLKEQRLEDMTKFVELAAKQSTQTEINAVETEREIEDLYKVIYMNKFLGEEFAGAISSVTSFGFFVSLENTIEGLVSMTSLEDDYYIFDEKRFCLVGKNKGKKYTLGDKVNVRIARADILSKEIDFEII